MITIENLKNVLSEIGFEKSDIGDYYKIDYTGCTMAVDFDNAKLIYPGKVTSQYSRTKQDYQRS